MDSILSLLNTPEPPHLTMKRRAGTRAPDELNGELDKFLANSNLDSRDGQLTRAAILLWHDHFEAAHAIAQDVEDADGSLLHGIIHRREPDFSNARYWFRRVGNTHRCFGCVADKVKTALIGPGAELVAKQLAPNDIWHPLAFVDLVEDTARRENPAREQLLREIQAAEFYCFLATLPSRVDSI
jgi:hypothetical protein